MYLIFTFITISLIFNFVTSLPLVFRGRPLNKHGMIGLPHSFKSYRSQDFPPEQWFEQILDHFKSTDTRIWQQRYYVNNTFFKTGCPVFLQLGGEGEASPVWVIDGQVATNYAPKFNALIILLEHRYYGASQPTVDLSVNNLQYLTSDQALEDTAYFIKYLTNKLKLGSSKWIVFGGSYAGALSAWFRLKYPHLTSGAIASSAPLVAVVNFQQYYGVVSKSLGTSCDKSIRQATDKISVLLQTTSGWKQIAKTFGLCSQLNGKVLNDVYGLMETFASDFAGIVQYNKDNIDFDGTLENDITIDDICSKMTNTSLGLPIDRYAIVSNLLSSGCIQYSYKNLIEWMSQINWNDSAPTDGARQWTYQTCTEFGFFQSSALKTQPFGNYFPINYFIQQCVDIFGAKINRNFIEKAVEHTNTDYGGLNRNIRKVVFPNGSIDPWHVLGVTRNLNSDAIAIYMNGTAHCADMYPSSPTDPIQLVKARQTIVKYLSKFIQ